MMRDVRIKYTQLRPLQLQGHLHLSQLKKHAALAPQKYQTNIVSFFIWFVKFKVYTSWLNMLLLYLFRGNMELS